MSPSGAAKAAFLSGNETRTEKGTDGPRLYGKVLVSVKQDNTPQARTGCQSDSGGGVAQFVPKECVRVRGHIWKL